MNAPTKMCTKCGTELPATAEHFYLSEGRLKSHCRTCVKEQHREYRAANSEKRRAYSREWRASHRAEHHDYNREYNAAHREEQNAYWRAYWAEHPDEKRAQRAERRARKAGNGGTHTAEDIRAQYARQNGKCFYCKKSLGAGYHPDHVTPLSKGGSNGPENIVIACPSCNLRKHAKNPQEFAGILL